MEQEKLPLMLQIEALLFTAAKYVTLDDLAAYTRSNAEDVRNAIEQLKQRYSETNNSLTILDQKTAVKLNVKDEYMPLAHKIVSTIEFEKPLMETLAVIAWRYPALQSDIIRIRHNKAYDHLSRLEEYGFIKRSTYGRTRKISLTQKFFEYFDLPSREQAQQAFRDSLPQEVKENIEITEKQIEETEKKIEDAKTEDERRKSEKQKEEQDADAAAAKVEVYDAVVETINENQANLELADETGKQITVETYGDISEEEHEISADNEENHSISENDSNENNLNEDNLNETGINLGNLNEQKADEDKKEDIFNGSSFSSDKIQDESKVHKDEKELSPAAINAENESEEQDEVDKKVDALLHGKEIHKKRDSLLTEENQEETEWGATSDEEDSEVKEVEQEYSDANEDTGEENLENLPDEKQDDDSDEKGE